MHISKYFLKKIIEMDNNNNKSLTLRALIISLAKVREERSYLQGTKFFLLKSLWENWNFTTL